MQPDGPLPQSQLPIIPTRTVILLHGLGRTRRSMRELERAFKRKGYDVINIGYPSRTCTVEEIVEHYVAPVFRKLPVRDSTVHFVTHSMGGILTRYLFKDGVPKHVGRVVMIAPPNHGSEVADALSRHAIGRFLLGVSGRQLSTDPTGLPSQLPPLNFECGIVLCDKCIDPILGRHLEKPHDGKVTVRSMHVDGAKGYKTIHASHTFSPSDKAVVAAAVRFVETGAF